MPVVTSGVVGALYEAMISVGDSEIRTASVLVPDGKITYQKLCTEAVGFNVTRTPNIYASAKFSSLQGVTNTTHGCAF